MQKISYRKIFHYFWLQIRKYRWSFVLAFAGYGLGVIGGWVIAPIFFRQIIDTIINAQDPQLVEPRLLKLILEFAAVTLLFNVSYRLGDRGKRRSESNTIRELTDDAFRRMGEHSYQFFTDTFAGALVAKTKRFIRSFEILYDNILYNFIQTGLQLVGTFAVLFFLSPGIAMFFLFWCLVYITVTLVLVRKRERYDLAEAQADSAVTSRLADVITNIINVKLFVGQERENNSFAEVTDDEHQARSTATRFTNFQYAIQGILTGVLEVGGMYIAIRFWLQGTISTGTIVLMQAYFMSVFGAVWNLGNALSRCGKALSEAAEMIAIFETMPDILDPQNPEPSRMKKGAILFDNVSFTYAGEVPVFQNFSFSIAAGERIGLVGTSGAGKSTITKLLLRFVDIQGGAITIDRQDIRRVRQEDLRANISYVPQDPILFHRSLRENICYAKPDATEEEVISAAQKAHAHEFISAFAQGYDTLVGERGVKLSGGERQRVAIARAFLKEAPVLILDEATSSLDSVSEKYIQEAFGELMKGKTTIVIAHRLSTIQKMDRIVVIEKGEIVEEGTHPDLLAKAGVYHSFWSHQAGGFIE